ncbi:MAG: rod shape-determining protein MreD [Vicinamibacterales bacterium]
MKVLWVVAGTALALALQTTAARFLAGGAIIVDFVLVVVIYAALASGPVTGLFAGTFAGFVQDTLSAGSGVIGIGGLAKTIVGFLTGLVGTQFIVAQGPSRFVTFFIGTLLHAAMFIGVSVLLGLRDLGRPYTAVLEQAVGNALVGVIAFQLAEFAPGAVERRRLNSRRPRRP